jgi:hypothetical protein
MAFQVEARNVAVKFFARDRGRAEHRAQSVHDVGVGMDPRGYYVLRVARLALEPELRVAFDVVLGDEM